MTESPYRTIKRSIADGIATGLWRIGDPLPSESALTRQFSVSRMTVNRAMRELASERLIRRVPGLGSFVADPAAQSSVIEIRNIADEIASRGNTHTARVVALHITEATVSQAYAFAIPAGTTLFRSEILHFENNHPIQLEDRLVNPTIAPAYLEQDFTKTTPNAFLTRVAPLQRAEHQVRAAIPTAAQKVLLQIESDESCLVVLRRTWSRGVLATLAELYHPGSRYTLAGVLRA